MSRNLLILVLLMSGTGCSATQPFLSTIVVTPPKLSFRPLPCGDFWPWTAIAVTYPSESLTPAPCSPLPDHSMDLVAFFEEDERPAPLISSEPAHLVTTVVPAMPAIVYLDNTISPQSDQLPVPNIVTVPGEITPIAHTVTTSTLPPPHVQVEPTPPTESQWKPATRIALASSVQASTAIRCDQCETPRTEVRHVIPVESLTPPVLVQSDLSELLTEIRNQRQLIEALQRDLTRERSADDAAIEELEAAVENLLVDTAQREIPTSQRK